jgi:cytoskeletal protein CcmA (bactofilin family)
MSVAVPIFFRTPVRPFLLLSLLVFGLTVLSPLPAHAFEKLTFEDVLVQPDGISDEASSTFGNVTVRGPVGGDVVSTFGDVRVYAPVEGDVKAEFGNVYVDSRVRGDVDVGHGEVDWGPQAIVGGDLYCLSCEMNGLPKDRIAGNISAGMSPMPGRPVDADGWGVAEFIGWFFGTLVFVAVAVLASVFAPRQISSSSRKMEESFGRSLLVGIASLPAAIVLSVVLAISLVGIPLLLLAAPAYLAFVFFGALVAAYFLGRRILLATGRYHVGNALAAAVGALILSAAYLIPFVGELILYGLALTGAGATIMALFARRRTSYSPYETYVQERRV